MTINTFKGNKVFLLKKNRGQIMLFLTFIFLAISLSIIFGIASPTIRERKISDINFKSKEAFYLAESGVEDAVYRLRNNFPIGNQEVISLNGNTVITIITENFNQRDIYSTGDVSNYQRSMAVTLSEDVGVSFQYGVQVGTGGIYLDSGQVFGNVYSNGPITASDSDSNEITGSAISANSPGATVDQSNGSGIPSHDVVFGKSNSNTQDIAQSFVLSNNLELTKIQLYLKKVSSPKNATVTIVDDFFGLPGSTIYATGVLSSSLVESSYGWTNIAFSSNPILQAGITYWLVVDAQGNNSRYYIIGANNEGYNSGISKIGKSGGNWFSNNPSSLDYFFKIFTGGNFGLISGSDKWNQLKIGTVSGNVEANTVNYINAVTGDIYCQSGTGNNKNCIYQEDPIYVNYPISDANIETWKAEAEAGGVINGDYVVGQWPNLNMSLGPKKIEGNLTVSSGGILTMTGTIWVTGRIILNGNGRIKLDPSYGTNDGVIVADGPVRISGGGQVQGSGEAGSYLMILTTDASLSAFSVSGDANAVIVAAPNGTVNISGGAALIEVLGNQINISGGGSVNYEEGLINNSFSSGPSGTWVVTQWEEIE